MRPLFHSHAFPCNHNEQFSAQQAQFEAHSLYSSMIKMQHHQNTLQHIKQEVNFKQKKITI